MAIPRPKPSEILDEEDWIDIERTKITLSHRMKSRREKNALYKYALARKEQGELLSGQVTEDGDPLGR